MEMFFHQGYRNFFWGFRIFDLFEEPSFRLLGFIKDIPNICPMNAFVDTIS